LITVHYPISLLCTEASSILEPYTRAFAIKSIVFL